MADASRDREERLFGGYSGRMALLLAAGWLSILLGRQALPPLLPTIIDDLAISPSRAGFALTLMMGLYATLQYPAGRLSDGLSRTTVLVASLGGTVLGFAALTTVTSYPGFLAGTALVGLSSAFYFSPSRAFLSDLFVEKRGRAFGLQTTAGMGGSALAAGLAVAALAVATWQAAFLPTIALLAGVLVLLHRWSREGYVLRRVDLDVGDTLRRLVALPGIRRLLLMRALVAFAFQAIVGFLPTLLQVEKGFGPALASAAFAAVFVVGSVAGPLAGRLSDRVARVRVVLGALVLALAGLVGLLVLPAAAAVVAAVVVMAAGFSAVFPVMQAALMDRFPDGSAGGDFGAAKTVYTGVGSLGPTYVGLVAERAGYVPAFAGLAAVVLVAALLMLGAAERG